MRNRGLRLVSWLCVCGLMLTPLKGECVAANQTGDGNDAAYRHTRYVGGYSNGTFRPGDPVSRGAAAQMLCHFVENPPTQRATFSDVPASSPFYESLGILGAMGIVNRAGGMARPDEEVSRGEFASMVGRVFNDSSAREDAVSGGGEAADGDTAAEDRNTGVVRSNGTTSRGESAGAAPDEKAESADKTAGSHVSGGRVSAGSATLAPVSPFSDVAVDSPYYGAIVQAAENGWMSGFEDGTFQPDQKITRAQAVCVLNRCLGRKPDLDFIQQLHMPFFHDVPRDYWAYGDIVEAAVSHGIESSYQQEHWGWLENPEQLKKPSDVYFEGLDIYWIGQDGYPITDSYWGTLYFGPDGRYRSGDDEIDRYVKDALRTVVKDGMTQEQKLHAAYNYARDSFSYLRRNYYQVGDTSWAIQEAKTMFTTKRGNCYCYAAVFYFLARQLGYDAKLISGKVNNSNPVPHGWAEIYLDGQYFMYDCELEMSYRAKGIYSYNFYHMAYNKVPWRYYR